MSPPGASPRPNSLTRSPAAPALLRLSEVFLDAGPPHVVRVPTYPPAGKSGPQAEFFARHLGHTLDAGGSSLPCPRHLPALLLVKGFLRQAELASVHRSRPLAAVRLPNLEVRTYSCKRQGAPRLATP